MITAERKFRPDIEGLRAVAVGLVVLGHARVPGFEGGYIGVDVFFVLSGFLITGLLLRERASSGSISMAGFYARRARRILPAASIVLVVTVLASYEWLGFLRGAEIAEDGKWAAVFAANLRFASEGTQYLNLTAPPSPLQHYWSLAVEEQFYLVWPIVFLIVVSVAPG
ncbi:MAG: acyltransferase [Dehalococcoidia bacterium]|nr:acyltransferase [Dehalococcoidia bacterium]